MRNFYLHFPHRFKRTRFQPCRVTVEQALKVSRSIGTIFVVGVYLWHLILTLRNMGKKVHQCRSEFCSDFDQCTSESCLLKRGVIFSSLFFLAENNPVQPIAGLLSKVVHVACDRHPNDTEKPCVHGRKLDFFKSVVAEVLEVHNPHWTLIMAVPKNVGADKTDGHALEMNQPVK